MKKTDFRITTIFGLLLFWSATVWSGHDAGALVESTDISVGNGAAAVLHSQVKVHYTGWLVDGSKFDSSLDRSQPFTFNIGAGQVIPGWEQGIVGMRAGGKRVLLIPPQLAYGKRGAGNAIPPDATLKFEIELLEVKAPKYRNISSELVQQKIDSGIKIIDIRRQDEWQQTGVVKGSILLTAFNGQGQFNQSFITQLAANVGKDEEFILICRTGNRSSTLANWLSTTGGYSKVNNVEKGIVEWIKQDRQVSREK